MWSSIKSALAFEVREATEDELRELENDGAMHDESSFESAGAPRIQDPPRRDAFDLPDFPSHGTPALNGHAVDGAASLEDVSLDDSPRAAPPAAAAHFLVALRPEAATADASQSRRQAHVDDGGALASAVPPKMEPPPLRMFTPPPAASKKSAGEHAPPTLTHKPASAARPVAAAPLAQWITAEPPADRNAELALLLDKLELARATPVLGPRMGHDVTVKPSAAELELKLRQLTDENAALKARVDQLARQDADARAAAVAEAEAAKAECKRLREQLALARDELELKRHEAGLLRGVLSAPRGFPKDAVNECAKLAHRLGSTPETLNDTQAHVQAVAERLALVTAELSLCNAHKEALETDRAVVRNLFVTWVERGCRRDALAVLAGVLALDKQQRQRVGLDPKPAAVATGRFSDRLVDFVRDEIS